MSATVHLMTGHVKSPNLSSQELSRLARFRQQVERQLVHLGSAIQDARKAKKWSRARLAREIPVDPKTVERWETGKTGGAMESLSVIAEALDTTTDDLLAAAASKGQPEKTADLMDALSKSSDVPAAIAEAVEALRLELVATRTQLLAEIAKVQVALEAPPSTQGKAGQR